MSAFTASPTRRRAGAFASGRRAAGRAALLIASLLLVSTSEAQDRVSGIQMGRDSRQYLINKNVGEEHWAITYDLDSRSITGNVFYPDGRRPDFLWCGFVREETAIDPMDFLLTVDCYASGSCDDAPCDPQAWSFVAQVTVPGSFLFPLGTQSTLSGNVQPIFAQSCATGGACHSAEGRPPRLADGLTWAAIFRVPAQQDSSKDYVTPFDQGESYLFDKILGIASNGEAMPPAGAPLGPRETEAIGRWIHEGAANN